ncbi:hypothetical protein A6A04_17470 [Paramagnetospirillum marisnigri]|uniref:adenine phosphoribosyltransferase n=1 Tax=Paramagnetospirillum marisnigri TaxID=1285242 RepID=A0A178MPK1_9PROT|nr:hypothetical protein [Paramagnetospirillum marisnigri]OAN50742.1 hypothetical protein A6A04_17470 [Paramagnetospirillum marisnigri]
MNIKDHIRGVPDFPKPGILFYDISTLLAHADAWAVAMGRLAREVRQFQPDVLAGIELLRKIGAHVTGAASIIELSFLPGRQRLQELDVPFVSLAAYDD